MAYKLESGVQLLSRLTRKPKLERFYPKLFESGLHSNEIIEINCSVKDNTSTSLIYDIICEAILPDNLGGVNTGVLIFNTDGNYNLEILNNTAKSKILQYKQKRFRDQWEEKIKEVDTVAQNVLKNLFVLDIYDSNQMHVTIQNLENILAEQPNISIIIFDTLTAFYWSELGSSKIFKMETYLKNLIKNIQKITKEYNVTILYTKPDYFSSSKEPMEDKCSETSMIEHINYKINVVKLKDRTCEVNIRYHKGTQHKRYFKIYDSYIEWN